MFSPLSHRTIKNGYILFHFPQGYIYSIKKNLDDCAIFGLAVRPTMSTSSRAEFLPSDTQRLPDTIATAECFSHHSPSSAALHQFLFSPRQGPISEERHCSGQTNFPAPRDTVHVHPPPLLLWWWWQPGGRGGSITSAG